VVHGLLIGGGTSASFGPVIADISLWFAKRRGVAVAICSSGSYLAGTVWPLMIQPLAQWVGWRHTYFGIAVFCLCSMLPLLLTMRRRLPRETGWHSAPPVDSRRAGAFAGGCNCC
jgi:MFS family permease